MRNRIVLACVALVLGPHLPAWAAPKDGSGSLKPPSAFNHIKDRSERSAALFLEAGKVINSPRCINCHPSARVPLQGDAGRQHVPPINAGQSGMGQPGLHCMACHHAKNVPAMDAKFKSIPGHEHWMLAPQSMAWQGLSLGEICAQLKDVSRNGGRNLQQISEHMGKDSLVGWAWHPGAGRTPAPGTQKAFGDLIQAWIDTGAQCPR